MCKILVISDVHGRLRDLRWVLQNETADAMFYLGDGLYDLNAALELRREPVPYPIYRVAGNCDVNYSEPSEGLAPFGGVLFFYTHGHHYGVKMGSERLAECAGERGASSEIVQECLQAAAGKVYAALDRADGGVGGRCDLDILVAGQVHREGDAQVVGQLRHDTLNLAGAYGVLGSLGHLVAGVAQQIQIVALVDHGRLPRGTTVAVDKCIAHDGEYPSAEIHIVDILVLVVQDFECGILKQILGVGAVGRQHVCEIV